MTDPSFLDSTPRQTTDQQPIRNAPLAQLDLEKVATHIERAVERGRYAGPTEPTAYLRQRKCLLEVDGALFATLGRLLCFGRTPQEFVPRAVIDLGHYRGIESVSYEVVHLEKDIGGTIFD